jgi:hypothetical protein
MSDRELPGFSPTSLLLRPKVDDQGHSSDTPMANIPRPPLDCGSSPKERAQYYQGMYDWMVWQDRMIQSLLASRIEQNERVRLQEESITVLRLVVQNLVLQATFKPHEPQVSNPAVFNGDMAELEHCISACERKFLVQPSQFNGEPSKVLWASSFLGGIPRS